MKKIQGSIQERGKVTPLEALKNYFKGIIDFGGRSTRASFWWVTLFLGLGILILMGLLTMTGVFLVKEFGQFFDPRLSFLMSEDEMLMMFVKSLFTFGLKVSFIIGILEIIAIILMVSHLALRARRYRDVGLKTPFIAMWMILIASLSWVIWKRYETWAFVFLSIFSILDFILYLLPSYQLSVPQSSWMSTFIMSDEEKESLLSLEEYADQISKEEPVAVTESVDEDEKVNDGETITNELNTIVSDSGELSSSTKESNLKKTELPQESKENNLK